MCQFKCKFYVDDLSRKRNIGDQHEQRRENTYEWDNNYRAYDKNYENAYYRMNKIGQPNIYDIDHAGDHANEDKDKSENECID